MLFMLNLFDVEDTLYECVRSNNDSFIVCICKFYLKNSSNKFD